MTITDDVNSLTALIKPWRGQLVIAAVQHNDHYAKQVIDLYNMYVACPEPGAQGLCEAAFKTWLENRG